MSQRIAVLGLGAMGLAMARRLASGLEVIGFDPDPGRRGLAEDAGVAVAASPAEAARGATFVLLAVRTQEHAETCLFGEGGAASALEPEAIVQGFTSTVGVAGARSIGERLPGRFLDLPVSGGPARAADGTLLVLAGGDAGLLERSQPVLDLLAETLVSVGPNPGDEPGDEDREPASGGGARRRRGRGAGPGAGPRPGSSGGPRRPRSRRGSLVHALEPRPPGSSRRLPAATPTSCRASTSS